MMQRQGRRVTQLALFALLALLVAAGLAVGAPVGAAPAPTTWEGTIQSVAPGTLILTTSAGQKTVRTSSATSVVSRMPAKQSDIKPGDLIGVDSKKGADGSLTAVSIHIFPPQQNGRIAEREFVMTSGDTMTNATVTTYVTGVSGRTLTLTYQGGTSKIAVPPGAPIERLVVIPLTAVRPKMHARVRGTANADGSLTATAITVDQTMAH